MENGCRQGGSLAVWGQLQGKVDCKVRGFSGTWRTKKAFHLRGADLCAWVGAERRIQKVECSKFYCLLKGKYTVIITGVPALWCWGEAIRVRVKVVRVHHAFARHQLIALDFGSRFESLGCFIPRDLVGVEDGNGSSLGLRMLKFVEDIAF